LLLKKTGLLPLGERGERDKNEGSHWVSEALQSSP